MRLEARPVGLAILGGVLLGFALGVWAYSRPPESSLESEDVAERIVNSPELVGRWRDARKAGKLVTSRRERDLLNGLGYVDGSMEAPEASIVTIHDAARAQPGFNLVTSAHAAEVHLVDMDGEPVHSWSCPPSRVWPEHFAQTKIKKSHRQRFFRRVLLLEDGSLIGIFSGLGIVRIDADSQVVWKLAGGYHHHLVEAGDGRILTLEREIHVVPSINGTLPVIEDYVVTLTREGEVRSRVSLIECFQNSRYSGVLDLIPPAPDIFHTNTVQLMDGSLEHLSPYFAAGNVLISTRHTNTVAIVDLEERRVVWALSGNWRRQHDPILLADGRMVLLDNLWGDDQSRLIEFDPFTQEVTWSYEGTAESPFHTPTCGALQVLSGGNLLVTESDYGRAFELTREGEIVWEYHSPFRAGPEGQLVATLFELRRIPPGFVAKFLSER